MQLNDQFNQKKLGFDGEKFVSVLLLVIFISLLLFGSRDIETPDFTTSSI